MRNLISNKFFYYIPLWRKGLEELINDSKKNPKKPLFKKGGILFLSITFLIISSCSNSYKNLPKTEHSSTEIQQIPYALPYSDKTLIYKADIGFYKNDISGLLIMKKMNDSIYRIALTTEFGLKIFDFELNNGTINVKYCVKYLNKKIIINTFQNDFNLLLIQNQIKNIFVIENPEQNQKIWQLKSGKLNYNYIQNTDSEKIENISFKKQNSEKISIDLYNYKGNIPGNITLEHHNIKLNMNLKLIQ